MTSRRAIVIVAIAAVIACLVMALSLVIAGDTAAAERFAEKSGSSLIAVACLFWVFRGAP